MKHMITKAIVLGTLLAVPAAAFASSLTPPASQMGDKKDDKAKAKDKSKDKKSKTPAPAPSH